MTVRSETRVQGGPVLELANIGMHYGNIHALRGVNITVRQGEVTCVLGDNGAGKSTLIKIVAGLHDYTEGSMSLRGIIRRFGSPRVAQAFGIATVYQDLALAPLMSVWRNFFLANEIRKGPFLDIATMKRICREELTKMGIVIPDLDRAVGSLSGGQRQVIAIARAIYFGARVIILDEPTAALGTDQAQRRCAVQRQRLLAQGVLAGIEAGQDLLLVDRPRRRDDDGVHVVGGDEIEDVTDRPHSVVLPRDRLRPSGVGVRDRHQSGVRQPPRDPLGMVGPHQADADDADP